MKIPELRSPYEKVGGIVYFGRMIDKIRLHEAGQLPPEYIEYLGAADAFDGRCCRFLNIDYAELSAAALAGADEKELLEEAYRSGRKPSEAEIEIWNAFMQKRGWRDEASARLAERKRMAGIVSEAVLTSFDFLDADEDRPLRFGPDPASYLQEVKPTVSIPGLRSPYVKTEGIYHFARMVDKIRLAEEGKLPGEWLEANGSVNGFDGLCCRFMEVEYSALKERVLGGGTEAEAIQWAFSQGRKPLGEEMEIWNAYLSKRSWRDQFIPRLHFRLQQAGMPLEAVSTMFDFIDRDEGRNLHLNFFDY